MATFELTGRMWTNRHTVMTMLITAGHEYNPSSDISPDCVLVVGDALVSPDGQIRTHTKKLDMALVNGCPMVLASVLESRLRASGVVADKPGIIQTRLNGFPLKAPVHFLKSVLHDDGTFSNRIRMRANMVPIERGVSEWTASQRAVRPPATVLSQPAAPRPRLLPPLDKRQLRGSLKDALGAFDDFALDDNLTVRTTDE